MQYKQTLSIRRNHLMWSVLVEMYFLQVNVNHLLKYIPINRTKLKIEAIQNLKS